MASESSLDFMLSILSALATMSAILSFIAFVVSSMANLLFAFSGFTLSSINLATLTLRVSGSLGFKASYTCFSLLPVIFDITLIFEADDKEFSSLAESRFRLLFDFMISFICSIVEVAVMALFIS